MVSRVSAHEAGPTRLRFSPLGETLLTGGSDAAVQEFDFNLVVQTPAKRKFEGSEEGITCIDFDHSKRGESRRFAVGAEDGIVVLYEADDTNGRKIFRQAASIVNGISFSPNGLRLAVASDSGLRIISTEEDNTSVTQVTSSIETGDTVLSCTWSLSNILIAATTAAIHAWDMSGDSPEPIVFKKQHRLTQTRQRNETTALSLPFISISETKRFKKELKKSRKKNKNNSAIQLKGKCIAIPKGKQIVLQGMDVLESEIITLKELTEQHEIMHITHSSVEPGIICCLDSIGYLTFIDILTKSTLYRYRPVLGASDEQLTDVSFHPTSPATILAATSHGAVQLFTGLYETDDQKKKEKKKEQKKARKDLEKNIKQFIDDEPEEAGSDEDDDSEHSEPQQQEKDHSDDEQEDEQPADADDDVEMEVADESVEDLNDNRTLDGGQSVIIRRQRPFQIGQTPPPGHPDVAGFRILCWNRIGIVRLQSPTTDGADHPTISVNFYDKSKYSTHRFTDRTNQTALAIAALGKNGLLLGSSAPLETNRIVYRSIQSWGTNPDWTRTFDYEEPISLAVGDLWVACFSDRYLRLFRHSGLAIAVISLPHRVICSVGTESPLNPIGGDIPLSFDPVSVLAYAYVESDSSQPKCKAIDVLKGTVVEDEMSIALTKDSDLTWLGWSDEGLLTTQDSKQVIRVLTHQYGRQWVPVYDPKSQRSYERLHLLSVRQHSLLAVVVSTGIGPDPRLDTHEQVKRPLVLPVLEDRPHPWPQHESDYLTLRYLLNEKKNRSSVYTTDMAKYEKKIDNTLSGMFNEVFGSSTTKALDIVTQINMRDSCEKVMETAYNEQEDALYAKIRQIFDTEFAKRIRKCRLPDKESKDEKVGNEEKLKGWLRQYKQREKDNEEREQKLIQRIEEQEKLIKELQVAITPDLVRAPRTKQSQSIPESTTGEPISNFGSTFKLAAQPEDVIVESTQPQLDHQPPSPEAEEPPPSILGGNKSSFFSSVPTQEQGDTDPSDLTSALSLFKQATPPLQRGKRILKSLGTPQSNSVKKKTSPAKKKKKETPKISPQKFKRKGGTGESKIIKKLKPDEEIEKDSEDEAADWWQLQENDPAGDGVITGSPVTTPLVENPTQDSSLSQLQPLPSFDSSDDKKRVKSKPPPKKKAADKPAAKPAGEPPIQNLAKKQQSDATEPTKTPTKVKPNNGLDKLKAFSHKKTSGNGLDKLKAFAHQRKPTTLKERPDSVVFESQTQILANEGSSKTTAPISRINPPPESMVFESQTLQSQQSTPTVFENLKDEVIVPKKTVAAVEYKPSTGLARALAAASAMDEQDDDDEDEIGTIVMPIKK